MELDKSLDQLRAEGKLDSHGQFTLDLAAQARKLGHSSGADPALCLLKMVQAAVASGAEEIHLTTTRSAIAADFSMKDPLSLDGILQEDGEHSPAEKYARHALLVAVGISPGEVSLACGSKSWSTSGKRVSVAPGTCRLSLAVVGESWWKQFLSSSQHAHLYKMVTERCAQCPIPVKLDRRSINRGKPEPVKASFLPLEAARGSFVVPEWLSEHLWLTADSQCMHLLHPCTRSGAKVWLGADFEKPLTELFSSISIHRVITGLDGRLVRRVGLQHAGMLSLSRDNIDWAPMNQVDRTRNLELCIEQLQGRTDFCADFVLAEDVGDYILPKLQEKHLLWKSMPGVKLSRWVGLPADAFSASRLTYCCDGVLMNPVEFAVRMGSIHALVAARVTTDLSGLEVVRDAQVDQDIAWAKQEGASLLERARADFETVDSTGHQLIGGDLRSSWERAIRRNLKH